MTTMSDVARVAGVSAKTVSRVFNDDPHVAPETRERVQWAMSKLNYVPNMLARSFRAGADAAVGLAFPDIADPFFAAMTSSIEEEMYPRSMAVMVTSLGQDPDRERVILELLLRRQISGLIVAAVSRDQSYLKVWQERTPIVFVDRPPRRLTATTVIEDDVDGSRQAVRHLAHHGHRRIAFVGLSTYIATTDRRLAGYRQAMRELALPDDPRLVCRAHTSAEEVAADLIRLLTGPDPPTAVFSDSNTCSMAVVLAMQRAGLSEHVALVGFGDFPMAIALSPSVTVVDQDPARLGRVAVDRLVDLIEDRTKKVQRKTVLPVRLIPRGSGELRPRG
jgi:LacI family transcriptional regulator